MAKIPATILGHVVFSIDPNAPQEFVEVERLNERLVARARNDTCTGEYGIGLGKQSALIDELGDAVYMMRMNRRAIDPKNLLS